LKLVASKLKVSYLMGSGNAHAWHDGMCQGHALVTTLVAKYLLIGSYIYISNNIIVKRN
jgi:hypothetical protein